MPQRESLIGRTFGKLTVIKDAATYRGPSGYKKSQSVCRCECGTTKTIRNSDLKNGQSTSCGCRFRGKITHGQAGRKRQSRTYRAYTAMVQRCTNPKNSHYKYYGARGITICQQWRDSFVEFRKDLGDCPDGLELDRIDTNIGYQPGNVRWSNEVLQARNRRCARIFQVNGITACLSELCERFGVDYDRVHYRLRKGWDIRKAMFEPRLAHSSIAKRDLFCAATSARHRLAKEGIPQGK